MEMETPAVRYTRTSDGFDIAYLVAGEGPPLVFMPFHFNQIERRWKRNQYARGMAGSWRAILYDSRGQGLSTRGLRVDPTPEDYRRDLETVIEANQLERFALAAYGGFAHVAIRYAVQHPERVHALLLSCTSESFRAWPLLSMLPLAEENWDLFLRFNLSSYSGELLERLLDYCKDATTLEDHVRLVRGFAESEISDLIPQLQTPVLLLHSESQHWLNPEEGLKLAAKIPNSQIVFLKGYIEPDDVLCARASLEFLSGLPPLQAGQAADGTGRTVPLSARQREVLSLLARGKTTREIAAALVLSERTVQRHIADLYARIGVRNRSEATAYELNRAVAAVSGSLG